MTFRFRRYNNVSALADSQGNIVINNVRVSNDKVELPETEGTSLHRGFKFDLTMTVKGTTIDLDLHGQAAVNGLAFRVQVFPEASEGLPTLLVPGSKCPWGKVIEVGYDQDANMWAVKTKRYPEGVMYRPGAGIIVCTKL